MSKPALRIGIVGLGAVGLGTVQLLQDQAELLALRAGRPLQLVAVSARDAKRKRVPDVSAYRWHDDPLSMAAADDLDVIVELIGGQEGTALHLATSALQRGKAYVTANKAMLSKHGVKLATLAEVQGAQLCFEAAVGGGVPVIKALREGMVANKVTSIRGILNGTCNYILSRMAREDCDFAAALKAAQDAGYAEADPTLDIDGHDALQKITVLAMAAFGGSFDVSQVQPQGIRGLQRHDVLQARRDGMMIKLVASATRQGDKVRVSVMPETLLLHDPLAALPGSMNAITLHGEYTGPITMTGAGAGGTVTACAVIADIIDIARGRKTLPFGVPVAHLKPLTLSEELTHGSQSGA